MRVCDRIIRDYLDGRLPEGLSEEWYFTASQLACDAGRNIFTPPEWDPGTREKVGIIRQAVLGQAAAFEPCNRPVWDALFPDWPALLAETEIDLIAGFPEPYDATVEPGPDGRLHVIFDLLCWTKYLGRCEIAGLVQNLLTHELCHIMLHRSVPGLSGALASPDYRINLDAVCFDEAFAHLVSYETRELAGTDWRGGKLAAVCARSRARMRQALAERDPGQQQKNLYEALCGDYYDKYACMCGMLYLAGCWLDGGIPALERECRAGWRGFAEKAAAG